MIVQEDFFASGSELSCDWSILLPSGPVGVVSMKVSSTTRNLKFNEKKLELSEKLTLP